MNFDNLKKTDPTCYDLVLKEMERQESTLELIPSECIASLSVIEALGTPLTNKYSEGYAGKRYYGGNEYIDEIENLAISRAKELFKVPYVNVQPYSGSPANFAVYCATCEPGDTIAGQSLLDGWHLTHGWSASMTGKFFNSVQYHVSADGYIDMENVKKVILENKPKLVWIGASAYPREFPFKEISEIAHHVGAYVVADIAHISWLVVSGVHPSPNPYVHIITTTTHKTLGWPRGGMIMVTDLWLRKDPDLWKKIDKAVFPGLQWWPHNHQTLAIAVALWEALSPKFIEQNFQIVRNAKFLAEKLKEKWFHLVSGGTDNHLILLDVGPWRGIFLQEVLDTAGITLNKNTIPQEPVSAFYPSGIRLGTPIMTMRGMKETEMKKVADFIFRASEEVKDFSHLGTKEERLEQMKQFKEYIANNTALKEIKKEVALLCSNFPIYR